MTIPTWELLPEAVWDAILEVIEDGEYECADSHRAYPLGEEGGTLYQRFEETKDGACCGSHEQEVTVDGKVWVIGFSYGH